MPRIAPPRRRPSRPPRPPRPPRSLVASTGRCPRPPTPSPRGRPPPRTRTTICAPCASMPSLARGASRADTPCAPRASTCGAAPSPATTDAPRPRVRCVAPRFEASPSSKARRSRTSRLGGRRVERCRVPSGCRLERRLERHLGRHLGRRLGRVLARGRREETLPRRASPRQARAAAKSKTSRDGDGDGEFHDGPRDYRPYGDSWDGAGDLDVRRRVDSRRSVPVPVPFPTRRATRRPSSSGFDRTSARRIIRRCTRRRRPPARQWCPCSCGRPRRMARGPWAARRACGSTTRWRVSPIVSANDTAST